MALPVLSPEQRAENLLKAAAARKARAEALTALKDGHVHVADAFAKVEGDSPFSRIPVRRALLALPGIGPKSADAIMTEIGIDASRKIRGLGDRQREALIGRLAA